MRGLVQRVREASVTVDGEVVGGIGPGLCVLVGVTHDDDEATARKLADRIWGLRIMADDDGAMGRAVADTTGGFRLCETSQAPAFYLPPDDVRADLVVPSARRSWCEWKGEARYWSIRVGDDERVDAAWSYDVPADRYAPLAGHVAFYPQRVDRCLVDGEEVVRMDGDFYGGWITTEVVGPFKGAPGTLHW